MTVFVLRATPRSAAGQFVALLVHALSVDGLQERTRPVRATTMRRVSASAWALGTSLRTMDCVRLGTVLP